MTRLSFIQHSMIIAGAVLGVLATFVFTPTVSADDPAKSRRLLYVAVPGIRDYLQFGGHGVLVFDIDNEHKFVRRIQSAGMNEKGKPINVKGICVSVSLGDVIEVATRKIITGLTDELGAPVHSEKLLEIDFVGQKVLRAGCQFGLGAVVAK